MCLCEVRLSRGSLFKPSGARPVQRVITSLFVRDEGGSQRPEREHQRDADHDEPPEHTVDRSHGWSYAWIKVSSSAGGARRVCMDCVECWNPRHGGDPINV